MAGLPPRLRDTLAAVARAAAVTAAAADLGVSRAEVHRRLAAARGPIGRAGLGDYLGTGETLSGRPAKYPG